MYYTVADENSKLGHTEETIPGKDATCTETGLTDGVKCSVCKAVLVEQEIIPLKEHTWADPDCTQPSTCTVCHITSGTAIGHKYIGEITTEPTCTDKGVMTYTCSRCFDTYTEDIAAKGHTKDTLSSVEPSCTETGLTEGEICSVCFKNFDTNKNELIDLAVPAAHELVFSAAEEASCLETGKAAHTTTLINVLAATCTENGYSGDTFCTVCEQTISTGSVISAAGHNWGPWQTVTPATEEADGEDMRICKICEAEETRTVKYDIPAEGERIVKFVNMNKMHFTIDCGEGKTYIVYNSSAVRWAANKPLTFTVTLYSGFAFDDVIVYVNGTELKQNADGSYTIPSGEDTVIISLSGASVETDSDGNVTGKLSFWELLIRFFKRIVAFFKGK